MQTYKNTRREQESMSHIVRLFDSSHPASGNRAMATRKNRVVSILLFLLLAFTSIIDGHRHRNQQTTITATLTSTLTTTTTKSTYTICASVSADPAAPITACRRRRQYWIDVPIYIALDELINDQLSQFFIHPANRPTVEPTADPLTLFKNDQSSESIDEDDDDEDPPMDFIPSQSIEPSWFTPDWSDYQSQIIGRLSNYLMYGRRKRRRRKTVVITSTKITTATNTVTSYTSTNTFFISGCTPASFPFSYC